MAKVTTIIDIGSNSMRMVVLKKSSRFAFNLINETKSRVKISEGSYENGGHLQEEPMRRAYESMKSFVSIAKALKSRKIICVATSALRDAPNSKVFLNLVRNKLGINIRIIDGQKEAYYGGVSALNLLHLDDFVTVDIGGGSTEFSFIRNGNIEESISLDIGTVRLKELYFNNNDLLGAKEYVLSELKKLEHRKDQFSTVVGIGGSIRALSKVIIKNSEYPLDVLHGFEYEVSQYENLFEDILKAKSDKDMKAIGVKKDRFDTIKEGTFIFKSILEHFNVQKVATSGTGVREGVYLTDLLRTSNDKFPSNFNPSVRSLLDRFQLDYKISAYFANNAKKIFDVLRPMHKLDDSYKKALVIASKLHLLGVNLNFYKNDEHTFNFILNGLNYGFSHKDRILIAHIVKYSKKAPKKKEVSIYDDLLPEHKIINWLSFMIRLNINLSEDYSMKNYEYSLEDNKLKIKNLSESFMIKSSVEKMDKIKKLDIEFI